MWSCEVCGIEDNWFHQMQYMDRPKWKYRCCLCDCNMCHKCMIRCAGLPPWPHDYRDYQVCTDCKDADDRLLDCPSCKMGPFDTVGCTPPAAPFSYDTTGKPNCCCYHRHRATESCRRAQHKQQVPWVKRLLRPSNLNEDVIDKIGQYYEELPAGRKFFTMLVT